MNNSCVKNLIIEINVSGIEVGRTTNRVSGGMLVKQMPYVSFHIISIRVKKRYIGKGNGAPNLRTTIDVHTNLLK